MGKSLDQLFQEAKEIWNTMSPQRKGEMRREQRRSFLRAEAALGSDVDEAEYRSAIARGDQKRLAELDAEAQERVKRVEEIMKEQGL